ncbi:MAG: hypothetical protein AB7E96_12910 [Deferribacterales bacterium]
MGRTPFNQRVTVATGDKYVSLLSSTAVEDDFFRAKMFSDFYQGYADISYDKGVFKISRRSLPLSDEQMEGFKGDLYAAYFAGGYPYKSSVKMFGATEFIGNLKIVHDTDGYELYKIRYTFKQIHLMNNLGEYSVVIDTDRDFSRQ